MNNELIIKTFKEGDGTIKCVLDKVSGIGWQTVKKILDQNNVKYSNTRKVIDEKTSKQIEKMIDNEYSFTEISKKLGIKYITINKYCKKNNLIPYEKWRKIDQSLYLRDIKDLAGKGKSKTYIGKKVGLSKDTVSKICKNNNISLKDKTSHKLEEEEVKNTVEKVGYKFLNISRSNNKVIVKAIHLQCGKERSTSYRDFAKHSCKRCSYTGTSLGEEEVRDWIEKIGFKTDKIKIEKKEIDVYIETEEIKLGIEYCGVYWHSERSNTNKNRHLDKMILCQKNNIRLITIFEDEWKDRQKQVKNFIKSSLGCSDRRFFARKCEIKEVPKKISQIFLDDNHIQGRCNLSISFGLYFEGELLGIITGNKHHRQGNLNCFVLNRLCFKDGVLVVGGASRLLKKLVLYSKNEKYDKLISWSDNRWSEGNVYEKTGFELTQESTPDYSYSQGGSVRVSKQSCQKKNLIKKGAIGTMENTERELALTLGLYRIWDCGKKRWEIKL